MAGDRKGEKGERPRARGRERTKKRDGRKVTDRQNTRGVLRETERETENEKLQPLKLLNVNFFLTHKVKIPSEKQ